VSLKRIYTNEPPNGYKNTLVKNQNTCAYLLEMNLITFSKAGFTLRRLDRRLDKRPAPLVKVAKSF